jgi:hypothetical protein
MKRKIPSAECPRCFRIVAVAATEARVMLAKERAGATPDVTQGAGIRYQARTTSFAPAQVHPWMLVRPMPGSALFLECPPPLHALALATPQASRRG